MLSFAIIVMLAGNRYFVKPKEIEMQRIYAERIK